MFDVGSIDVGNTDFSTFGLDNVGFETYDVLSDIDLINSVDFTSGLDLSGITDNIDWGALTETFNDYGNFDLSVSLDLSSIDFGYENVASLQSSLRLGTIASNFVDTQSFISSLDMYTDSNLFNSEIFSVDVAQQYMDDMGFENEEFESWQSYASGSIDSSGKWSPENDMTFMTEYSTSEYSAMETMFEQNPELANKVEMNIWGGGSIEAVRYLPNGTVDIVIDNPSDVYGFVRGIFSPSASVAFDKVLTGASLGSITINPVTGILVLTGLLGSAFNKETTYNSGGNMFESTGMVAAVDAVAEFIGLNDGDGLSDISKRTLTMIEIGYRLPSLLNNLSSSMSSLISGVSIGNIGIALYGAKGIYSGFSTIYKATMMFSDTSTANKGDTSSMLDQMDLVQSVNLLMVETQDFVNGVNNAYISLMLSELQNAYATSAAEITSNTRMLITDSVGSLAGSTSWNNVYGGSKYFSPYTKMIPGVFASKALIGDTNNTWYNNHVGITERHNSKFNQFAGNRQFITSTFGPFTF